MFLLFIFAVACGIAGYLLLEPMDNGGAGAALGFLLGPIGILIAWIMRMNAQRELEAQRVRHDRHHRESDSRATAVVPSAMTRDTKVCPDCAETIKADARICRFCRREFSVEEIAAAKAPREVARAKGPPREPKPCEVCGTPVAWADQRIGGPVQCPEHRGAPARRSFR
ncbi:hypothetical protein J421_4638 (plasmid) [Gemmatirosa kalamazoonensis]|uniref:Uncharacterized protein n=1 Tax=Gemmatirosa kalamazoonensis TaxID=861299 RepID=W0RRG1_9BACT|nr:zinc ribbon domain-containing protein [Gemmatirosa kalamazoonensis]AHG92105.1 hypothetical protein J421_4570 [Gemmatirosa kalamazoonensis]AHG92173.1 hypothetical protein J421_4638 [Gemmatirosa kalamazoonensis]